MESLKSYDRVRFEELAFGGHSSSLSSTLRFPLSKAGTQGGIVNVVEGELAEGELCD